MTDDLDRLRGTAPAPRAAARDAALRAGMMAFDAETAKATKGSAAGGRLMGVRHFIRRLSMPRFPAFTPALAFTLAATVALPTAVLVWRDDPTLGGTGAVVAPPVPETRTGKVEIAQADDVAEATSDPASPPDVVAEIAPVTPTPRAAGRPVATAAAPEAPVAVPAEPEMTADARREEEVVSGDMASDAVAAPAGNTLADEFQNMTPEERAVTSRLAAESGSLSRIVIDPQADMVEFTPPTTERYAGTAPGGFLAVADTPVSTFSIDVDTASYARLRRAIMGGQVPLPEMVRTEEVVNAFAYDYPAPTDADVPFRATTTLTDSPWTPGAKLLHVGIKGYDLPAGMRPAANLVFLVDTSGSMQDADKLPLLRRSLEMMLAGMDAGDTISLVTYAGSAEVLLEPTPATETRTIRAALERMTAGGGTAGAEGIDTAYALAEQAFVEGGANRVILATDGDFNIGPSDPEALERLIAAKRETGVFLTVLGFGIGNLRDDTMQALAQAGNGTAAYIDSLSEARRVLVEGVDSALFTIARDVKLQVEFNPAQVDAYRLLGYETRALAREDFADDRVDAGEIGAGHTVTAIYEVVPKGVRIDGGPLRYETAVAEEVPAAGASDELAFLQIRYKPADRAEGDESRLLTTPIGTEEAEALPGDVAFSIAAAAFAEKLRAAPGLDRMAWAEIAEMARDGVGEDRFGRRRELVELIELTGALSPQ